MTAPRRRGPAPRFSREQLVDAALAVVEQQGFAALSLRSVARQLEVGPMTLYTYVESSDQLAALVIDRMVAEVVSGARWPKDRRGVLRLLAKRLDALVAAHPAMIDAYAKGLVRSEKADQFARDTIGRLVEDGMDAVDAREAYVGVHSLVLGFALIRSGRELTTTTRDPALAPEVLVRHVDALLDRFE